MDLGLESGYGAGIWLWSWNQGVELGSDSPSIPSAGFPSPVGFVQDQLIAEGRSHPGWDPGKLRCSCWARAGSEPGGQGQVLWTSSSFPLPGAVPPGAGRDWKPFLGSGTASGTRLGACDEFPEFHPTKLPLGAALATSRHSKQNPHASHDSCIASGSFSHGD